MVGFFFTDLKDFRGLSASKNDKCTESFQNKNESGEVGRKCQPSGINSITHSWR